MTFRDVYRPSIPEPTVGNPLEDDRRDNGEYDENDDCADRQIEDRALNSTPRMVDRPGIATKGTSHTSSTRSQQDDRDDTHRDDYLSDVDCRLHPSTSTDAKNVEQPERILQSVLCCDLNNRCERTRVQTRTANESTIDVKLSEQIRSVISVDAPTVQNRHLSGW